MVIDSILKKDKNRGKVVERMAIIGILNEFGRSYGGIEYDTFFQRCGDFLIWTENEELTNINLNLPSIEIHG